MTPDLIAAARKEGKLSYYSALELNVAERLAKAFEAKYPDISVRVERSGAERIYQRIAQEQGSGINAVDVANSTDPAHYLDWKGKDWLAPYLPDDVAKHFPADQVDPDGTYATSCGWIEAIGYNTSLVKPEEAPKSYADLLDPKWQGKIVKAHPGYSGAIMTATFVLSRELGWSFFEKLAQQKVLQVQSAADPPRKLLLGERAVMADGNDYNLLLLKAQGKPVEVVYASEGSPLIIVPSGVFRTRPIRTPRGCFRASSSAPRHSNCWSTITPIVLSMPQIKEKPGRQPLSALKLLQVRSGRGAGAERGHQGALCQALQGLIMYPGRLQFDPPSDRAGRFCCVRGGWIDCEGRNRPVDDQKRFAAGARFKE